jgi:kynureninase
VRDAEALELDAEDELRDIRERFYIADPGMIYLDGNSLGRMPKRTPEVVRDLLERQWGTDLVGSWKHWFELPQRLGAKIAQLIGAGADEVVVCDSTSVNLYKLTVAALRLQAPRTTIVTDAANFPSDLYITSGIEGASVRIVPEDQDIAESLTADTALLSLSHVLFKSGRLHDMEALTSAAHDSGAFALWDLSHSVGALPIDLNACGVDLAVGCSYKYISGGPGAPAFLYVRRDLQQRLASPIQGWFGHRSAFDFDLDYAPAEGIPRFLAGTPAVLSMAAMEPALDLLLEAGMDRIRAKSLRQTDFLIAQFDKKLAPLGFKLVTPRDHARRGSHVAFAHPEAWRICQALIAERNLVPDFRAPDVLRLGVTPLYTTFEEFALAVNYIAQVVRERRFENYSATRLRVT